VALGVFMLVSGMVLLWIDIRVGMPPWWTVMDGPFGVAIGAVYLVLQFRSRVEVYQEGASEVAGPSPEPSADESEAAEADRPDLPEPAEPEPSGRGWGDRPAAGPDEAESEPAG